MKSFLIRDILSNSEAGSSGNSRNIQSAQLKSGHQTNEQQQRSLNSPLDALFQMTSSTFDALKRGEKRKEREADPLGTNNFSSKQSSKKKRKSRTAFTNNQIYELERRFTMQRYLSPTDRDEIAMTLNLSNAQVITWFQNRRAKLKRDQEEKRRDVETMRMLSIQQTFLESIHAISQMSQMQIAMKGVENPLATSYKLEHPDTPPEQIQQNGHRIEPDMGHVTADEDDDDEEVDCSDVEDV